MHYTQTYLRETDFFDGEGLEVIGVRISEIPNYTVKNRHRPNYGERCWTILYDNFCRRLTIYVAIAINTLLHHIRDNRKRS